MYPGSTISKKNVLAGIVVSALFVVYVAAQGSIDVVVIGNLSRVQHRVSGSVYALNESLLIIDQFTFDGQGAGVFINIATEGNNRGQWIANRKIVDYPSSIDARPIERPYLGERLFIQLPGDSKASDIKWLTIWCEIFGISFGEVQFPNLKGKL